MITSLHSVNDIDRALLEGVMNAIRSEYSPELKRNAAKRAMSQDEIRIITESETWEPTPDTARNMLLEADERWQALKWAVEKYSWWLAVRHAPNNGFTEHTSVSLGTDEHWMSVHRNDINTRLLGPYSSREEAEKEAEKWW